MTVTVKKEPGFSPKKAAKVRLSVLKIHPVIPTSPGE
jgi:hypothetical protein